MIYFGTKHPVLIIWKARKGPDWVHVYVSGGYLSVGAGKGIALPTPVGFASTLTVQVSVCGSGSLERSSLERQQQQLHQPGWDRTSLLGVSPPDLAPDDLKGQSPVFTRLLRLAAP